MNHTDNTGRLPLFDLPLAGGDESLTHWRALSLVMSACPSYEGMNRPIGISKLQKLKPAPRKRGMNPDGSVHEHVSHRVCLSPEGI